MGAEQSRDEARPLVSFVLLAYNQERFIREALSGAFAQDYECLEIIVSDDCSTDATADIIERRARSYAGPHEVIVNRMPANVGLSAHFNECLALARGEIVVLAAGDDVSLPTRVARSVELLRKHPGAAFVSFSDIVIDAAGRVTSFNRARGGAVRTLSLSEYLARDLDPAGRGVGVPHPSGASRAFRRAVFAEFGALDRSCPIEDIPCVLRGLMIGDGLIAPEPGICYRWHGGNVSSLARLSEMHVGALGRQVVRDAERARSASLISECQRREIERWVERSCARRHIAYGLHRARRKMAYFSTRMLLSSAFSAREKVWYARRIVRAATLSGWGAFQRLTRALTSADTDTAAPASRPRTRTSIVSITTSETSAPTRTDSSA